MSLRELIIFLKKKKKCPSLAFPSPVNGSTIIHSVSQQILIQHVWSVLVHCDKQNGIVSALMEFRV